MALGRRGGYWGDVTATIDWCEPNYAVSPYIAEFYNTWSNIWFIVLGLYGLHRSVAEGFELRFHLIYANIVVVGIGSAMFHGTLTFVSQQCDETPMVWSMLLWFYILYAPLWQHNAVVDTIAEISLTIVGIAFAILHAIHRYTTAFQLLFAALVVVCLPRLRWYYSNLSDRYAKRVAVTYLAAILLGTACWLIDYHYCDAAFNLYGHVWWHVFMSINAYCGPLFMQYVRADSKGQQPSIQASPTAFLVTIVVSNKKTI
ncbi:hypothetical protein H310_10393 [Aphanomyces invadans]|uniref:Alkaline ceramidase 3 n=1 Tax=Aphanomyces invadans TaxID=157072 RepID=A0A024TQB7_9STRA|nr:hypothetical protein H310_10393 [Aphanomyces invadans]ETV96199.1 hypothetical protein H310_10393 [Aphanomyces invadans]|eukprot:XP_008874991.1 hypothetical protein H310_10393 [Aphanomyces invadans]